MKHPIHFAHANGIPTATYRLLLDQLRPFYQLADIPLLGHDPDYPVTDNWTLLMRQLLRSIESQHREPCYGIGHSLGGALTLMAAAERPDLFKGVILLDVPVLTSLESAVVYTAKKTGLIDQITPAKKSRTRRTNWPDKAYALKYFRERKMFSRFHEQCLTDYVDSALIKNEAGSFDLGYKLEVELAVYRTMPHRIALNRSNVNVPMAVLVGKQTDTVRKHQYQRMKNRLGFTGKRTEGSHMFPLEYPLETAREIHHLIQQMEARS